jgi:hypothetical protein
VTGKEVSDIGNPEAIGLESEATTDPAGGPESQADCNGER